MPRSTTLGPHKMRLSTQYGVFEDERSMLLTVREQFTHSLTGRLEITIKPAGTPDAAAFVNLEPEQVRDLKRAIDLYLNDFEG